MRLRGQLQRVYSMLEAAGLAGLPCPTNTEIADAIGAGYTRMATFLLNRLQELGLVRVIYITPQRRVVEAADGSWRTRPTPAPNSVRDSAIAPRRCLRCRDLFMPEHRGRFCCDGCWAVNQNTAIV